MSSPSQPPAQAQASVSDGFSGHSNASASSLPAGQRVQFGLLQELFQRANVAIGYSVVEASSYSGNYHPSNILVDRPQDLTSRWSGANFASLQGASSSSSANTNAAQVQAVGVGGGAAAGVMREVEGGGRIAPGPSHNHNSSSSGASSHVALSPTEGECSVHSQTKEREDLMLTSWWMRACDSGSACDARHDRAGPRA